MACWKVSPFTEVQSMPHQVNFSSDFLCLCVHRYSVIWNLETSHIQWWRGTFEWMSSKVRWATILTVIKALSHKMKNTESLGPQKTSHHPHNKSLTAPRILQLSRFYNRRCISTQRSKGRGAKGLVRQNFIAVSPLANDHKSMHRQIQYTTYCWTESCNKVR